MKIAFIQVKNFLGLKDIKAIPKDVNIIHGKNGKGKSSLLRAIETAFTGKTKPNVIHVGEDKAEILIEVDNLKLKRVITETGSKLILEKDGERVTKPQTYLKALLDETPINPLEFFNAKTQERKAMLLKAIAKKITPDDLIEELQPSDPDKFRAVLNNYDFSQHALEVIADIKRDIYDRRRELNRTVKELKQTISTLELELPDNIDPNKDYGAELEALLREKSTAESVKLQQETYTRRIKQLECDIEDTKEQIKELEERLRKAKEKLNRLSNELEQVNAEYALLQVPDTTKLDERIKEIKYLQGQVLKAKEVEKYKRDLKIYEAKAEAADRYYKKLTELPTKILKDTALPVQGLEITKDTIKINGIDLDLLSSSEKIKLALNIAKKLSKTKIICLDGIEALDPEALEALFQEIANDEFQYFITKVSDSETLKFKTYEKEEIKNKTEGGLF